MRTLTLLLLLTVAGCGDPPPEPTLDCSSESDYIISVNRIWMTMSKRQKLDLDDALKLALKEYLSTSQKEFPTIDEAMKPLHGMTGRQIIATMKDRKGKQRTP